MPASASLAFPPRRLRPGDAVAAGRHDPHVRQHADVLPPRHDLHRPVHRCAGRRPGTPVRRSGIRIGEVQEVKLDDETSQVRTRISIDPGFTIRRNETPTLITSLLGTDATIDFVGDTADNGKPIDRAAVPPGSTIQGTRPVTSTPCSRAPPTWCRPRPTRSTTSATR